MRSAYKREQKVIKHNLSAATPRASMKYQDGEMTYNLDELAAWRFLT